LAIACVSTFFSLWIDKGFGLIVGGFVPNPFERVTEYWPTLPETLITLAVWSVGFLVLTILYKIAVSVKEEAVFDKYGQKQIKS
jgi:molybdopterin-containing oxidoreductase family membrane subunit